MKRLVYVIIVGCCMSVNAQSIAGQPAGTKTTHLNDTLWSMSEWISVADAPVVSGKIKDSTRAADGANWFAATITNDKEVGSAKWMTTALGTYDIYVNGQLTGFLGTSVLMPVLTDNGMSDLAYELLLQRKNPSWLYSIDNGATTIWERWNSYMIEKGMGPQGMNSFNHYAYGCVCQWLWNTAAGIASDPSDPGFRHIIMRPIPDQRLGHLSAEYRSPAGTIKSDWHYEGDTWVWTFTIPEGATASVTLPGETTSKVYSPGTYTLRQ